MRSQHLVLQSPVAARASLKAPKACVGECSPSGAVRLWINDRSCLQVLVLDHNLIGDAGFATLATGLKRCKALERLSLASCGLGPPSAACLAGILIPSDDLKVSSLQPSLKFLNLSGNVLGGAGLSQLCPGLKAAPLLGSVALAGVGVGSHDLISIRELAEAMAVNSCFAHLDFAANEIGALCSPRLTSSEPSCRWQLCSQSWCRTLRHVFAHAILPFCIDHRLCGSCYMSEGSITPPCMGVAHGQGGRQLGLGQPQTCHYLTGLLLR